MIGPPRAPSPTVDEESTGYESGRHVTGHPAERPSSVGGPVCLLGRDSAGAQQDSRHDRTEDESTDVCEERDTTATVVARVDQRAVALEELVEEPATEKEPCRNADREPRDERVDA